jgi:hypothetical protein
LKGREEELMLFFLLDFFFLILSVLSVVTKARKGKKVFVKSLVLRLADIEKEQKQRYSSRSKHQMNTLNEAICKPKIKPA